MSLEPDAEHKSFLHLTDVNSDVVSRCIKNVRLPSSMSFIHYVSIPPHRSSR